VVVRRADGEEYPQYLFRAVRDNWTPPPGIPNAELRPLVAALRFKLGYDGSVDGLKVSKSSGHPEFDSSCIAAVTKAAPFEAPPDDKRRIYARGLMLVFSGETLAEAKP
jgi:TonB family protein